MSKRIDSCMRPLFQIHDDPNVVLIRNILSPSECKELIELAGPLFKPSTVIGKTGMNVPNKGRTSHSAHLPGNHALVQEVVRRCGVHSAVPTTHFESIQIVRYEPSQFYNIHHDGITALTDEQRDRLTREGQRLETFFIYLNDMEPGETRGSTHFPELDDLKIKPECGTAVFWHNCMPGTENIDKRMYHAGLPPLKSVKYGLNVWTRSKPRP